MAEKIVLTDKLIYEECLKAHAYKWMADYPNLNGIAYVELMGGPIMSQFIRLYGAVKVINDLDLKLNELIQ